MNIFVIHEIDWKKKVLFEPHHFAELLSILGHNVFVLDCPAPDSKNFFKGLGTETLSSFHRVYKDAKITLIRPASFRIKGLNRLTHFFTCKKQIKKIIQENNIDIVLLYGVATNGIQTVKICHELKIPLVFRALDTAHALVNIPILKQIAKKYEKTVLLNASLVLATTTDLSNYAISMGANKDLVSDFHLGVNLKIFKPMNPEKSLISQLNISNEKIISFMGTLYPFAGIDDILKNYKKIEQHVSTKFLIIGGGPSLKKLQKLSKQLDLESRIIFTDFIDQNDIPKYLALSDLCLNPFKINHITNNIIPTKILEYFACKKPVLSTPLKGTKRLLPDENFGIAYSDSSNFVDTIADLLQNENKLKQLGQDGYNYVISNHDWELLSQKLVDKFEQLIKSSNKSID